VTDNNSRDSWTIPKPAKPSFGRLKPNKDRYNGLKFFVALLLPIAAVVATYFGLIKVPDAAGSTVVVLIVAVAFVAFVTYAFNQDSRLWHWAAVVVALIAGILVAAFWASISDAFGSFSIGDVFWFIVALAVDLLFAFWVSRNVVVTAPNPSTRRGQASPQADTRASRRHAPRDTPVHEIMEGSDDQTTEDSSPRL
jgi:hypothetical protein